MRGAADTGRGAARRGVRAAGEAERPRDGVWRERHQTRRALWASADLRARAVIRGCDCWPVVRDELAGIALLQWPWSARAMDEAAAALDACRPRVVVTYAEAGGWGRAIVLESRRRGIPSVGLQHGFIYRHWLNYLHEPDEMAADVEQPEDRGFPSADAHAALRRVRGAPPRRQRTLPRRFARRDRQPAPRRARERRRPPDASGDRTGARGGRRRIANAGARHDQTPRSARSCWRRSSTRRRRSRTCTSPSSRTRPRRPRCTRISWPAAPHVTVLPASATARAAPPREPGGRDRQLDRRARRRRARHPGARHRAAQQPESLRRGRHHGGRGRHRRGAILPAPSAKSCMMRSFATALARAQQAFLTRFRHGRRRPGRRAGGGGDRSSWRVELHTLLHTSTSTSTSHFKPHTLNTSDVKRQTSDFLPCASS